MALCQICRVETSKYTCPKCKIPYCSLKCYKSTQHQHHEQSVDVEPSSPATDIASTTTNGSKFDSLLNNEKIQYLLKQPALQFHLLSLITILQDGFIRNLNHEQKLEVMNLKLTDLRAGGIEENELVDEFVHLVLQLTEEQNEHQS
ncbi:uncharacterized protein LODBEIA_P48420 [Lodderomyces beijingensis]|uniref:HIT-type domain-containing protein n=1 Tax=Lodderomyces beijingensis TaxID=1775926 RepID=A0ABP0ZR30_9ASCO